MQFTYQTERLLLKILSPEYAPAINTFYLDNKLFLEPFEPQRPQNFYTTEFHRANLHCEQTAFLNQSHFRYWLFLKNATDEPIGSVCFNNIQRGAFQKCSLGYKLGKKYCHCGFMQEALSLLLPIAMTELRLHRIEAYVQPANHSSIKLLSKLGFIEEGYLTQYAEIQGKWTDHLIFSYLEETSMAAGSSKNQ